MGRPVSISNIAAHTHLKKAAGARPQPHDRRLKVVDPTGGASIGSARKPIFYSPTKARKAIFGTFPYHNFPALQSPAEEQNRTRAHSHIACIRMPVAEAHATKPPRPPDGFFLFQNSTQLLPLRVPLPVLLVVVIVIVVGLGLRRDRLRWGGSCTGGRGSDGCCIIMRSFLG